jgi:large subunit ribosomal protein L40
MGVCGCLLGHGVTNIQARAQKDLSSSAVPTPKARMVSVLSSASRAPSNALRSTPSFVRFARKEAAADPQRESIRRALYPSNLKNKETPTGGWRPDVGRALQHAIPSVQAHNTIERAWLLHRRHVRKQREAELTKKFDSMKKAMQELYEIDSHLYMEANKQEDSRSRSAEEQKLLKTMKATEGRALDARIRGLFPREMRLPTDTPPRHGWNYDWKPFHRPI